MNFIKELVKIIGKSCSNTAVINGLSYRGKSIVIDIDGQVIIDGSVVGNKLIGPINIQVVGDCNEVGSCSGNIEIKGDVTGDAESTSGNVTVTGSAYSVSTTSGDANIGGEVKGDVETVSGDITCGNIAGDVETVSGDIRRK